MAKRISIHALREEGDESRRSRVQVQWVFLSTPSARRATRGLVGINQRIRFLSTPSARRATTHIMYGDKPLKISIHALREEGDREHTLHCADSTISIHALREEGDPAVRVRTGRAVRISIHALREEGDAANTPLSTVARNFYPRPPRGGRRLLFLLLDAGNGFLSTPSARRATHQCHWLRLLLRFLSTPSARRATHLRRGSGLCQQISIHALREEGDTNIQPVVSSQHLFLSTPSARRATTPLTVFSPAQRDFYPRPPRGGRPDGNLPRHPSQPISIHALREEGDALSGWTGVWKNISIHALREEGDMAFCCMTLTRQNFYPRPPRGGRRAGP